MAIADVDGDGLIDYNEFVAATMHLSKLNKEELLQRVRLGHMLCIQTC
jgi:calcium-dependent protein kinase